MQGNRQGGRSAALLAFGDELRILSAHVTYT